MQAAYVKHGMLFSVCARETWAVPRQLHGVGSLPLLLHTWSSDRFAEYWIFQNLYLLYQGSLAFLQQDIQSSAVHSLHCIGKVQSSEVDLSARLDLLHLDSAGPFC